MPQPLVIDWIRHCADVRNGGSRSSSAWDEVDELVRNDPEAGWTIILELIEAAQADQVLADIAAGPLEDLLHRSPDQFLDRMEVQARQDFNFRRCLTGVWGLSTGVVERLGKYIATVENPL
jgi:hypothetical protein